MGHYPFEQGMALGKGETFELVIDIHEGQSDIRHFPVNFKGSEGKLFAQVSKDVINAMATDGNSKGFNLRNPKTNKEISEKR